MLFHSAHDCSAEEEEDQVVVRRVARIHQVPVRRAEGPVEVFAAAVDPGEGLLVQQADEPVVACIPLEDPHHQLLVVRRYVSVLVDRRHLVLTRRDLVMARLHRHAQPVEVHLDGLDTREHALVDLAEVVGRRVPVPWEASPRRACDRRS